MLAIYFKVTFRWILLLLQRRDEIGKAMENHFGPQPGGGPPPINICPPSPQNNDETKIGNFS